MHVPENTLAKWLSLRSRDDINEILKANLHIKRGSLYKAFKLNAKVSDAVYLAVRKFYHDKEIKFAGAVMDNAAISAINTIPDEIDKIKLRQLNEVLPADKGLVIQGIRSVIEQGWTFKQVAAEMRSMWISHPDQFRKIIGEKAYDLVFNNSQ
jgi:hypothetical protein